jgi:Niemann-Pick C1 protein
LEYFLADNPNEFCSKGGHASYGDAINYTMDAQDIEFEEIKASYYMAYHSGKGKTDQFSLALYLLS